jgi:hypothetical protein
LIPLSLAFKEINNVTSTVRFIGSASAAIFAVLVPCLVRGQEKTNLPAWSPSTNSLKQLADESRSSAWAIRPPAGYPSRVTKAEKETRTLWASREGALSVIEASGPAGRTTVEQALEAYVQGLKGRARNLEPTPLERGSVGGKTFVRIRYSADGLPLTKGRGYGFAYATFESKTPIVITGFGTSATIAALEASAQTFRILN